MHRSVHAGLVCASQSRAREMTRGRKSKKCPFAKKYIWYIVMQAPPSGCGLLDVLISMSDCRQESVEKMERRILAVSYLYWMDLYNGILCCGFLCAHLISVSLFRLPRRGLPRPYRYIQANRLPRLHGYYTRATTLHANFWVQAGYHTCG